MTSNVRYVADECLAAQLVTAMREIGLDIQRSEAGLSDAEVLAHANEQEAVVVTHDYDFPEMAVRFNKPAVGVVLVDQRTLVQFAAPDLHAVASRIAKLGSTVLGQLTMIDGSRTRQRAIAAWTRN